MPEVVTQQQGQPQGQPAGWSPPQGEEWRRDLPDSLREKPLPEIIKWGRSAHDQMGALNNDLGKFKQDQARYQQDLQKWQQAANQYQAGVNEWANWYNEHVKPHWDAFEQWRNGTSRSGQPAAQAAGQPLGADAFKDWASLDPQQQAQILAQHVLQQIQGNYQGFQKQVTDGWQQYQKQLQDYVGERERYLTTYLKLWQQAFEARQKDPNLDVDKAVQEAIRVMSGQVDPFALGVQLSTAERDKAAFLKQAREQWEAEAAAKAKNAQIVPPASSGTPPIYRAKPAQGTGSLREQAAQALLEKYGAGIF